MKKLLCLFGVLILALAVCSCSAGKNSDTSDIQQSSDHGTTSDGQSELSDNSDTTPADTQETSASVSNGEAKEFTSLLTFKDDRVEFCLPEDHDGVLFTDMGANCNIYIDRYSNDVVAYHEYDNEGETVKKTVGDYTFDYQKFNHFGIEDWRMYVIRIVHNGSYYRFIYNVYAKEYDDAQVEKFMKTISFLD